MSGQMVGVGLGGFIVLALVYLVMKMALGAANAGQNAAGQMFKLGDDQQQPRQHARASGKLSSSDRAELL